MNRAVVIVLAIAACKKSDDKLAVALPPAPFDEVAIDVPPGMSDLSLDERGHLWGIPERDHVVAEIELVGDTTHVTLHPLDGVPDGLDTESLAWLGGGKIAVGTEGQNDPTASVMFGELQPNGHIALTSTVAITSSELGLELKVNHGAEGLCGHGDDIVVGIESFMVMPDNSRWAPIVRMHAGAITRVQKLMLSSDKGKLSALFCTFAPNGDVEVIAIERHYGVSRIITFTSKPDDAVITPKVALDLWPVVRDRYHEKLNLEGIVKLPDGRVVMINDNQGARVDGPTKLFVFHSDVKL